jgi:hypothetical protein
MGAMTTARSTLTALALAATVALAGCGDDEPETEPTSTPTPSVTTSATPSATPSVTPTPTETPSKSATPSESAAAATSVEVTIEGDAVSPMAESVELEVGEPLVLDVTSDRAGELHVHSNPEQTFAVEPGSQTIEVVLDKPGQVDIEEHGSHALVLRVLVR